MLKESNEPILGMLRWGANSYTCITNCALKAISPKRKLESISEDVQTNQTKQWFQYWKLIHTFNGFWFKVAIEGLSVLGSMNGLQNMKKASAS